MGNFPFACKCTPPVNYHPLPLSLAGVPTALTCGGMIRDSSLMILNNILALNRLLRRFLSLSYTHQTRRQEKRKVTAMGQGLSTTQARAFHMVS